MASSALLSCPASSRTAMLDLFVCNDGQIVKKAVRANAVADHQAWLRSGNAMWSDGTVDHSTLKAIVEGRGIWAHARITDLFRWIPSHTPADVLAAIALTESNRNGRPWPWTINYKGRGYFFESKEEAIAAAKSILDSGSAMFDIGIMQINWHWHSGLLGSLSKAFDPVHNIAVADHILQQHLRSTGSLNEAIGRYHSKTPGLKQAYQKRVKNKIQFIENRETQNPERTIKC